MIAIIFNRPEYEYDVHSLVKAFFPKEDTVMYYTCAEAELAGQKAACTHHGREELERKRGEGEWTHSLTITYGDEIRLVWQEEPQTAGTAAEREQTVEGSVERERIAKEPAERDRIAKESAEREPTVEVSAERGPTVKVSAERELTVKVSAERGPTVEGSAEKELTVEGSAEKELTVEACHEEENAVERDQAAENARYEEVFPEVSGDRIATKRRVARGLYRLLSACTGVQLPWGTLIGIRPTKIPMKLMEEGRTDAEIAVHMREEHLVSEKKIRLAMEIAKRERRLLSQVDAGKGFSLYIGIPFCPSTCLYCSFTSYPLAVWKNRLEDYLGALEKEIAFTAERFAGWKLSSVYIGGGTPTTLEPLQLDRLLGKLEEGFDLGNCLEFTVEAGRPDSVTREKLEVLREHGITRISINPQTMKQETLDLIGRHHTVDQTIQSFELARELGFDNINMDLIIGLPDEELEDVRRTMEAVARLGPDNVTVHSLAVKRAARLNILRDVYRSRQMVNSQEHMELCEQYCRSMGLSPYYLYRQKGMAGNLENVGYAAKGKAGLYNILIMEEVQSIVALGAGSITKRVCSDGRIGRCENVKDVGQYIDRIEEMLDRKRILFEE